MSDRVIPFIPDHEHIEVTEGNTNKKLGRYYQMGLIKPGQKIQVTHELHCNMNTGLGSECDCNPTIKADGMIVVEVRG